MKETFLDSGEQTFAVVMVTFRKNDCHSAAVFVPSKTMALFVAFQPAVVIPAGKEPL